MVSSSPIVTKQQVDRQEWLVVLPDNKGVLPKRMELRPAHRKAVEPDERSGFFKVGGGILEDKLEEGEPLRIAGSFLIACAKSSDEVKERLQKDVHFEHGIWDWDKLQIYPVRDRSRLGSLSPSLMQHKVAAALFYF
ncbi:MAG: hypothetical protein OHK93_006549 [Ramalina farinacea]|uniref:YCII-related domain-containing protein n=1 Tax=Ramalina farinacea TaxID=258253 RepID=A0AA43QN25_9LECA|nr:hypothetical protein [Ramalina farinacea]